MDKKEEEEKVIEQLCEKVEEQLKKITEQGISTSNIDFIYKLVDIHKDIANEKYWKKKEEYYMNYRNYGEDFGRRYGGEYGRRGVKGTGRGRYRGEEAMMEMQESYDEYNEAYEEAMNGNYGAEGAMQKSAENISKSALEIMKELLQADDPQVKRIVQKTAKKMLEMSEMM